MAEELELQHRLLRKAELVAVAVQVGLALAQISMAPMDAQVKSLSGINYENSRNH